MQGVLDKMVSYLSYIESREIFLKDVPFYQEVEKISASHVF